MPSKIPVKITANRFNVTATPNCSVYSAWQVELYSISQYTLLSCMVFPSTSHFTFILYFVLFSFYSRNLYCWRIQSVGMRRPLLWRNVLTPPSGLKIESSRRTAAIVCLLLASSAYSSILKMEVVCSSETSVTLHQKRNRSTACLLLAFIIIFLSHSLLHKLCNLNTVVK
jgi:hypothetical protein